MNSSGTINIWSRVTDSVTSRFKEEKIYGIIAFGSFVRGPCDEFSDIDIAVIYSGKLILFDKVFVDDVKVDILGYPIERVEHVLENKNLRGKYRTWYTVCFWLNLFRNGCILYDPQRLLMKWKKIAEEWSWSSNELGKVYDMIESNISYLQVLYRRKLLMETLISLRDTISLIIVYQIMKRNNIPSFRPKELCRMLDTLDDETRCLYDDIMGLNCIDNEHVEKALELTSTIMSKKRVWSHYTERAYFDILKSVKRNNKRLAVLSSRYLALNAIKELLQTSGYDIHLKYFDARNHLFILDKTKYFDNEIYETYINLHKLGNLQIHRIRNMIHNISTLEF